MAGFYFGKSRWDHIPETLGLVAHDDGYMRGMWRGHRVEAHFYNQHDQERDTYYQYTTVGLKFDPPLGVASLEGGELFARAVPAALKADVTERCKRVNLKGMSFSDAGIDAVWSDYQSNPGLYRETFDLMAWAADIVMDLRAKNPPRWEIEIAKTWPPLAQGWKLSLDPRAGIMKGPVRGRTTSARVVNHAGTLVTAVEVDVPLPAGCTLSLARQDGDGFFTRLFRGQDIIVGDSVFDAAFVIKGEPERFVRAALTPLARQQILQLSHAGVSIELKDGKLIAQTQSLLTSLEPLDRLMGAAFSAALALCPEPTPQAPPNPYR